MKPIPCLIKSCILQWGRAANKVPTRNKKEDKRLLALQSNRKDPRHVAIPQRDWVKCRGQVRYLPAGDFKKRTLSNISLRRTSPTSPSYTNLSKPSRGPHILPPPTAHYWPIDCVIITLISKSVLIPKKSGRTILVSSLDLDGSFAGCCSRKVAATRLQQTASSPIWKSRCWGTH